MAKLATCLFVLIFGRIFEVISIDYEKNTQSILSVSEHLKTTSVFIFYADDNGQEMDLQNMTKKHNLVEKLSRGSVSVTSTTLSKISEAIGKNNEKIQRTLLVVFLTKVQSLNVVNTMSEKVKISFLKWLLIFGKEMEYFSEEEKDILILFRKKTTAVALFDGKLESSRQLTSGSKSKNLDFDAWIAEEVNSAKKFNFRNDFNGMELIVGIVKRPEVKFDSNGKLLGFNGEVLRELEKVLNFSVGSFVKDNSFGKKNVIDGKWNGIIKEVGFGEADIGINLFAMTSTRLEAIDFTHPLAKVFASLYVKQPETYDVSWLAYFEVFEYRLWSILIVAIITTALLIALVKKYQDNQKMFFQEFNNCLFNIWRILCQQGTEEVSKMWPVKIIILSTFVTAFLISSIYSAFLTGYLVVLKPSLPFHDLESFQHVRTHDLITLEHAALHELVLSNDTQHMGLVKILKKNLPRTIEEAATQVCREKVALFMFLPLLQVESETFPCKLIMIKTGITFQAANILPKNSPYKEMLNVWSLKFREDGRLAHLMGRFGYAAEKVDEKYTIGTHLNLKSVAPIFALFIFGYILCILVYSNEKFCKFLQKKK